MVRVLCPHHIHIMGRNRVFSISVGIYLLVLQTVVANAGWFGADFSADVVKGGSKAESAGGRMYVSRGRVRTEIEQDGVQLIEIIDPAKGIAWVVDPEHRSYRQRQVPKFEIGDGKSNNPCTGISGAQCRQLPNEILNGRTTTKWQLNHNGKQRLQWNDAHHGFPVQVVERGKVVMSMVYLAEEHLNGRKVERWRALQHSGNAIVESEQWYDPQLNIAIRQVAQDGSFRELRNIRLGEQDDSLFAVPQGYSKMDNNP